MANAKKFTPFVENIAESTAACLVTMLQGNLLAISLGHWIIASQTGLAAGLLASTALLIARTKKRWVIAVLLGVTTAIVDFFVHPGMFGSAAVEAIVTGVGAAALSYLAGMVLQYRRDRRAAQA